MNLGQLKQSPGGRMGVREGLGTAWAFSKDMAPSTEQQHLLVHAGTLHVAVFRSWRAEAAAVRCTHIF